MIVWKRNSRMLTVFSVSFFSVLKVFLICLAGIWLAQRGLMSAPFRRSLSLVVMTLMLPCLLITKLSQNVNLENLVKWIGVPCAALAFIVTGFLISWVVIAVCRPPRRHWRIIQTSMAFGNSGYIPYPLVAAIAATAPLFSNDPSAGERGVAYVSLYLVCMSPTLWGVGYPYLAHKPWSHLRWDQILSPPIISAIAGIVIGITPPLRQLLVERTGSLRILFDTAELAGQATIPCALLVLGANLADNPSSREFTPLSAILAVAWGRLILMPLAGMLIALGFWRSGLLPRDPMCLLVLLIECTAPSATNLILMCQSHNQGESVMSRILVTTYILAVPTMTVFVALYLWLIQRV